MDLINSKVTEYIELYTSEESDVLKKLNRETHAKILRPRMLSGQAQGKFLEFISRMIKPEKVLEIGTYTGYSAICLAQGLSETGMLYTIDINEELETFTRPFFKEAGLDNKINYIIGDAVKIIPTINESFDIIFIDADKENYCKYFDLVIDKLKIDGYIIADNVFWSGKIFEEINPKDVETNAVVDFNNKIKNDKRVEQVMLSIRDGIYIARKIK